MKYLVAIASMCFIVQRAYAECAMFLGTDVESPNGKYRMLVAPDDYRSDHYRYQLFAATKEGGWKQTYESSVPEYGHHPHFFVSNDGHRLALVDAYAGVWVFDAEGHEVGGWDDDAILRLASEARVGQWTCHPDGGWATGQPNQVDDFLLVSAGHGTPIVVNLQEATIKANKRAIKSPPMPVIAVIALVVAIAAVATRLFKR